MRKLLFDTGVFAFLLLLTGCGETTKEVETKTDKKEVLDPNKGLTTAIDGRMFAIPSAIQLSQIIEQSGVPYDGTVVNSSVDLDKFVTQESKALNFGVYGADVGYMAIYKKTGKVLEYMNLVRSLANDLDISKAFKEETFRSIANNLDNRDTLLVNVSNAFREGNEFLKQNNKSDVAMMIVVGTWVESVYIACKLAQKSSNQKLINRIGEQKYTINDICEYLNTATIENEELKIKMNELNGLFGRIYISFTEGTAETNVEEGYTVLGGDASAKITDEQLEVMTNQLVEIRKVIIE